MAVPTITSVTPSSGPTMGRAIVKITGSNFLYYEPPATGYIGGSPKESVRVWFGADQSTLVNVISAMELLVLVPVCSLDPSVHAFSPVDVRVANVSVDGTLIPSEEVTLSAGFTFVREPLRIPTLEIESPYKRVTTALLCLLRREIVLNSGLATHTDYSPDGVHLIEADVPSVFITGPDVIPDEYGAESAPVYVFLGTGQGYAELPPPEMFTFQYDIKGLSDNSGEFLTLMGAVRKFCKAHPYLEVQADAPAATYLRSPLVVIAEATRGSTNYAANLHEFNMTIQLRRIPILLLPAKNVVWPIEEIELQTQAVGGILVEFNNL